MSLLNPINGARYLGGGAMRGTGYGVAKFGEGGEWVFGLIKNAGYSLHAYGLAHQLLAQAITVKDANGQFIMNAGVLADQLQFLANAGIKAELWKLQSNGQWVKVEDKSATKTEPTKTETTKAATETTTTGNSEGGEFTADELAALTMGIAEE